MCRRAKSADRRNENRRRNMNIPSFFRSVRYPLFFLSSVLLIFLATWDKTQELEDIKYIFAFLCFPFLLLFARSRDCCKSSGAPSSLSRIYWAVFLAYVLYTLGNWHFLSYPYYGTRSMAYLWFTFLSFMMGVVILSETGKFRVFCLGCIISGVIASLYSLGEYLTFFPYFNPESWPPRVTGLLAHKNAFAVFVMNGSIWTMFFIVSGFYKKWNPLFVSALIVQLLALLIGDSRGTMLLMGVGFIGIFLPMLFKSGLLKKPKARYFLYGGFFLCALIPLVVWDEYFWQRVATLMLSLDGSAQTRGGLYNAEWKLFLAHPVFGCGVGNFIYENIPLWPEKLRKAVGAFFFAHNAESDFLETLTETGIVGLAFYCFFLFGAVVHGIRELKREWKWETYIVLVLVVLLLCNGIYDTALRRLPCGIILWAFAGYLWRTRFTLVWLKSNPKPKFFISGTVFLVHCILAVFFARILAGDFFYRQSYVTHRNMHPQSGKMLQRALEVCPFHQDALFQEAFIGIRTKQYDVARRIADRLDEVAPHMMPTNFVKGLCAVGQKHYAEALFFADEEIGRNPNYIDAYELKVNALAGLGKCREMSRLQDSLCVPLRGENESSRWGDTVSASTLKKMYLEQTNWIRALAGGTRLKEAYRRYQTIGLERSATSFSHLRRIYNIKCGPSHR